MNSRTKKLTTLAMLSALAYVVMFVTRGLPPLVSAGSFGLKYDPKDIVIAIGGFIYGPVAVIGISTVVSFIEMITVSSTGPYGFLMNVIASCAFSCTAAIIYKKIPNLKGAFIGLLVGFLLTVSLMMPLNYLIVPLYTKVPPEKVVALLIPLILPFNLIKCGINSAVTFLMYIPLAKKVKIIPSNTKGI